MKYLVDFVKKRKTFVFIGSTIVILSMLLPFFVLRSDKKPITQKNTKDEMTLEDLQESEVIPTVNQQVKVSVTAKNGNREVLLSVDGIPTLTDTIEYELSYFAKGDLPKGALGNIDLANEKNKNSITRTITLGTCSSGTCVYDEGVTSVHLTLKFNGSYGARLFEKEYSL